MRDLILLRGRKNKWRPGKEVTQTKSCREGDINQNRYSKKEQDSHKDKPEESDNGNGLAVLFWCIIGYTKQ